MVGEKDVIKKFEDRNFQGRKYPGWEISRVGNIQGGKISRVGNIQSGKYPISSRPLTRVETVPANNPKPSGSFTTPSLFLAIVFFLSSSFWMMGLNYETP